MRFDAAPGSLPPGFVDNIGDPANTRLGLETLFTDLNSDRTRRHAAAAITFGNGDKLFYRSEGTGVASGGVPQTANGQWFIDGGTGKFEGAKGQGTYEGRTPPGGTRTYNLEGEITLAK